MMKVALFDFDDTISCSSWLTEALDKSKSMLAENEANFAKFATQIRAQTHELESAVLSVLKMAAEKNLKTFVVSNAEFDWLNFVMANFFPLLSTFLSQVGVQVISAREQTSKVAAKSGSEASTDPIYWKIQCFSGIVASIQAELPLKERCNIHLISIGDGMHERIACKVVATQAKIPYTSLKLLEAPNPMILTYELSLIMKNFDFITSLPAPAAPSSSSTPAPSSSAACAAASLPAATESKGEQDSGHNASALIAAAGRGRELEPAFHDLMVNFSADGYITLFHCLEHILLTEMEVAQLQNQDAWPHYQHMVRIRKPEAVQAPTVDVPGTPGPAGAGPSSSSTGPASATTPAPFTPSNATLDTPSSTTVGGGGGGGIAGFTGSSTSDAKLLDRKTKITVLMELEEENLEENQRHRHLHDEDPSGITSELMT